MRPKPAITSHSPDGHAAAEAVPSLDAPVDAVVDAVVIGRNEGARLVACLAALQGQVRRIVYVDSGSTDGSVAAARDAGARVVALDTSRPFTAARARNASLAHVAGAVDAPPLVQIVDGDCALHPGWIAAGRAALAADPHLAVVFGRRRERFPQASVYNRLCDWEWDGPTGPVRACGGDALMRLPAIMATGGYRDEVIAAEDDELCQRLLAAGWGIARIDAEMSLHDAAILRFGQWWQRAVRAGHGFAQVGGLHPGHFVAARRRVWLWGAVLPVVAVAGLVAAPLVTVAAGGLYAASYLRGLHRFRRGGMAGRDARTASALITLSKVPNLQGMLLHHWRRARRRDARLIEYK